MAIGTIGTFDYTYGAGSQNNRQVHFSRTGAEAGTIQAQVFVLNPGGIGNFISTISGDQIDVERESTTSKVNAMVLKRDLNPNEILSALTTVEQNAVIGSLKLNGVRKIEVINDVGGQDGLEQIVSLNILDPS